jgi:hypothetical protein
MITHSVSAFASSTHPLGTVYVSDASIVVHFAMVQAIDTIYLSMDVLHVRFQWPCPTSCTMISGTNIPATISMILVFPPTSSAPDGPC